MAQMRPPLKHSTLTTTKRKQNSLPACPSPVLPNPSPDPTHRRVPTPFRCMRAARITLGSRRPCITSTSLGSWVGSSPSIGPTTPPCGCHSTTPGCESQIASGWTSCVATSNTNSAALGCCSWWCAGDATTSQRWSSRIRISRTSACRSIYIAPFRTRWSARRSARLTRS